MASSEKLVLGAAGKKATTGRKVRSAPRNRRSLKDLYSDDRSNSKNNDVSEGSSGKPSGSTVHGKRRLDPTERDDDHGTRQKMDGSDRDREQDHDENPLAITLYKGEDDDHGTQQTMDVSDREHDHDYDHGHDHDDNPLAIELYKGEDVVHDTRPRMDESDREHVHDENPLAIELYKDEDDRQKLSELTELQREMILTERAMERSEQEWTENLAKWKAEYRRGSCSRPHTRETQKKAERAGALAELARRRSDRKSNSQISTVSGGPLTLAVYGNPSGSGSGSHGVEGSSRRNEGASRRSICKNSAINNKPLTLAICGSTSRSQSGDHDVNRELALNDGTASESDEEDIWSKTKVPTYENIRDITIQRSTLEKWYTETFFEELIVGCFVRLAIGNSLSGPVYRLCPVRRVDRRGPDSTYEFDNKTTYKYLNVVWGPDSTATSWQMISVSNASPTKKEFDQWLREVKRFGGFMPTKVEAREKRYAIQQRNFLLENRAIVLMDKNSIVQGPSSIAAEKVRLRSELETVDDVVEVERIKARLQELDAARATERDADAKAVRLAEMNRRNKIENLRNASEKKPVNANLKAGEPGYDPFSRRWTRSTNYFLAKSSSEGQKNDDATAAVADSSIGVAVSADPGAGTEAASGASKWSVDTSVPSAQAEAVSGAGKSVGTSAPSAETEAAAGAGKSVDASAPVEQGTDSFHNFDLSISLDALQKFGGPKGVKAAFMARKQRIEANLGRKVQEDDGRKHDRTLTVTEYMKRRGLL
ncbi:protein RTF1 homolog [Sesamum indicum]|uniref:Protein RTF1 homolog n=1 Tax=Sesamum indicum TaxID=4182 RepID=A0A6I9TKZ2_SESIN|nr:protein RTF1 homolog [Sesamum indicum]